MLRTAPAGHEDQHFLLQVYAASRREEVAQWGWDREQQEAFFKMQFEAQSRSFEMQYPDADHRLVLYNGQKIGRIIIVRSDQEILLADIALLPEFRSAGIGGSLIRDLQAEAARTDSTVLLHVIKSNRARGLYTRLGFGITGESDTHFSMRWHPPHTLSTFSERSE